MRRWRLTGTRPSTCVCIFARSALCMPLLHMGAWYTDGCMGLSGTVFSRLWRCLYVSCTMQCGDLHLSTSVIT